MRSLKSLGAFLPRSLNSNKLVRQPNQNQLITVQFCKVLPSQSDDYVKAVKEYVAALKQANIPSAEWYGHWQSTNTYMYATPIASMSEFDFSYRERAIEILGEEKFNRLTYNMEEKLVEQKLVVYQKIDSLCYQHSAFLDKTSSYREWTLIKIDPSKKAELKRIAEERIKLYKENNIHAQFEYFQCTIGDPAGSIVVVNYAQSPEAMANINKIKKSKIGDQEEILWNDVRKIMRSYDQITGYYLPELSYLQTAAQLVAV